MEVFNINELSDYLHCSISMIRKLVREKKLPYFRIGNRLNFKKEMIDTWIYNQSIKNINNNQERKNENV